ncbi:hypothetical protein [Aeromonas hydrophila]|uniref:hypothetical protein n=1 Tax=Aeromonas hydrophila TaxID=644 RepID=UPI002B463FBB|nr:hypothetical protein [Aeromonas hydrophila]
MENKTECKVVLYGISPKNCEDVLMPLAAEVPPHEVVTLQAPLPLAEVLGSRELSRESLEQLFGQFAAMVEGDPLAAANLPKTRRFAAALLILREWMHHLSAERVVLAD